MNPNEAAMQSQPGTADGSDVTAQRARVLVVDDVFDNRDILTRRLVRRGFDVVEAGGGAEALEKLSTETFDIVLLDIMMPDIDGNEVLRTIRKTKSALELPVIMVSAKSQSEDVVESLKLDANDYVTKPVDFPVALARINAQLERKRAAEAERSLKLEIEKKAAELHLVVKQNVQELITTSEKLAQEANERRQSEQRLQWLAYHDALTGLLNRTAFREAFAEALQDPARLGQEPTLLFIDLDRFKAINDIHGHAIGDRLLQQVAARLKDVAPIDGHVARLGGDEFATFVMETAHEPGMTLAQRIVDVIMEPFLLGDQQFQIGASCGVARASDCSAQIETLFKAADIAMYRAKVGGRSRPVLFEPKMFDDQRERNMLEVDLRRAIQVGELEVYYQPLVSAASDEITAFEALVRWPHPERGMMPPDKFIAIAEETGLIIPLGSWVLEQACAEAATWPGGVRVAVNLSPLQFRDNELVKNIVGTLAATGLEPKRLELEITESGLLEAGERNVEILRAIRSLGVRVSVDDFGTGYSSMSYLQSFELDKIKIDRRFIQDLKSGKNGAAILRAIVDLGTSIGVDTTAEGIETEAEAEAVKSQGCTEMQGYLFSRPVTAAEARAILNGSRALGK